MSEQGLVCREGDYVRVAFSYATATVIVHCKCGETFEAQGPDAEVYAQHEAWRAQHQHRPEPAR